MSSQHHPLLKASKIEATPAFEFHHPLNSNSEVYIRRLGSPVGLTRLGISLARVPAGKESFIYHAHTNEEEWLYILSGKGIAEIGDEEFEVQPGDFMGFALPQVAHHLRNPFEEDLVYLMGGENLQFDMGLFPRLDKRVFREGQEKAYIVDDAALQDFWKAGEEDE
ncbi:MAG: cupin domain-containing protein [Cyanobacteria bacterium P01_G01_bin.38]